MKRILILWLLLIPCAGYCQYFLRIDSLMIYDIIESEPANVAYEEFGEGPVVYGFFTFFNHSESPLIVQQPNCSGPNYSINFCYYYGKEKYSSLSLHPTMKQTILTINAMDSIRFECGVKLMIDIDLNKSQKYISQELTIVNHKEIFKSILPSLFAEMIVDDSIVVTSPVNTWIFEHNNDVFEYPIKIYPKERYTLEEMTPSSTPRNSSKK